MTRCQIVPPYLLERIAHALPDEPAGESSTRTLGIDQELRAHRLRPTPTVGAAVPTEAVRPSGEDAFTVHTADNGTTLPGRPVRSEGEPAAGDPAVDEAYVGIEAALALFREVFDRESYDGRGAPVVATVHYDRSYDNAFWDGRQLVFGDGDGRVFDRFTKPVDVLGHELAHAVTQHTAGLTYDGQSGALNESVSDVFASCLKQRLLGQDVHGADWLIGEGIFLPSVRGRALRSMAAPGTAYDDPALGKDPQVASMADYVETTEDNGGVHLNSGIPNRAFHLAATGLGGTSWDGAGRIWWAALTSGIGADTDFRTFAAATVRAAGSVSRQAQDVVRDAWGQVGVDVEAQAPAEAPTGMSKAAEQPPVVAVTRSGGFAGVRQTAEIVLGDDPRTPEVETLLCRIDLQSITTSRPQPDRFVYTFRVQGTEVVLGEQDLTPELEQLARTLLDE